MNFIAVSEWLKNALIHSSIHHTQRANYSLQYDGLHLTFTAMLNYTVTPYEVAEIRNIEIISFVGNKSQTKRLSNKSYNYIESVVLPIVQTNFYN